MACWRRAGTSCCSVQRRKILRRSALRTSNQDRSHLGLPHHRVNDASRTLVLSHRVSSTTSLHGVKYSGEQQPCYMQMESLIVTGFGTLTRHLPATRCLRLWQSSSRLASWFASWAPGANACRTRSMLHFCQQIVARKRGTQLHESSMHHCLLCISGLARYPHLKLAPNDCARSDPHES
jgi:hypothetical protein